MTPLSLSGFERRRACMAINTPRGFVATVFGAIVLGLIAVNFGIGGGGARSDEILPILGAAWSSMAAVHAIDRNRNSVVEDVWFALEPVARRQLVGISAAWLPIAYAQALLTSLVIIAAGSDEWSLALLRMHAGFALGIPACLLLSVCARLIPGFALLAGFVFIMLLLFARSLWPLISGSAPLALAGVFLIYILVATAFFYLLTPGSGRVR